MSTRLGPNNAVRATTGLVDGVSQSQCMQSVAGVCINYARAWWASIINNTNSREQKPKCAKHSKQFQWFAEKKIKPANNQQSHQDSQKQSSVIELKLEHDVRYGLNLASFIFSVCSPSKRNYAKSALANVHINNCRMPAPLLLTVSLMWSFSIPVTYSCYWK